MLKLIWVIFSEKKRKILLASEPTFIDFDYRRKKFWQRPLLYTLPTKPLIPCISKNLKLNSLKLQNNWRKTGDFYEITTRSKSMEITELWKTFFSHLDYTATELTDICVVVFELEVNLSVSQNNPLHLKMKKVFIRLGSVWGTLALLFLIPSHWCSGELQAGKRHLITGFCCRPILRMDTWYLQLILSLALEMHGSN